MKQVQSVVLTVKFPHLNSLTLRTPHASAASLLTFLGTSPLAALHLALSGREKIDEAPVRRCLEGLSTTLRQLRYASVQYTIGVGETRWLRRFCEGRGVVLARSGEWNPFFQPSNIFTPARARGAIFDSMCSSLEEVLAFGVERVATVRRERDLQGVRELLEQTGVSSRCRRPGGIERRERGGEDGNLGPRWNQAWGGCSSLSSLVFATSSHLLRWIAVPPTAPAPKDRVGSRCDVTSTIGSWQLVDALPDSLLGVYANPNLKILTRPTMHSLSQLTRFLRPSQSPRVHSPPSSPR